MLSVSIIRSDDTITTSFYVGEMVIFIIIKYVECTFITRYVNFICKVTHLSTVLEYTGYNFNFL